MKTIIYDSNCKFCKKFLKWSQTKVNFLTLESAREKNARKILYNIGVKFVELNTIYFIDDEVFFVRSKAIFRILSYFPFP